MELTVERELFAKEMAICSRAAERRLNFQSLAGVQLTADKSILKIACTDLELSITSCVACDSQKGGSIYVSAERLLRFAQGSAGDNLFFELKGDWLHLSSGVSRAKLPAQKGEEFPVIPSPAGDTHTVKASEILRLIGHTAFCISDESDKRFNLQASLLSNSTNGWLSAATNSRRLSVARYQNGNAAPFKSLISKRACLELLKVAAGGESLEIKSDANNVAFYVDGVRSLVARKMDGSFPDVFRIIKADPKIKLQVGRTALLKAIALVSYFSEEGGPTPVEVNLALSENALTVSATSQCGDSEQAVPVEYVGDELRLRFFGPFLHEALSVCEGDAVEIHIWETNQPIHIIPPNEAGTIHLIQPRS